MSHEYFESEEEQKSETELDEQEIKKCIDQMNNKTNKSINQSQFSKVLRSTSSKKQKASRYDRKRNESTEEIDE